MWVIKISDFWGVLRLCLQTLEGFTDKSCLCFNAYVHLPGKEPNPPFPSRPPTLTNHSSSPPSFLCLCYPLNHFLAVRPSDRVKPRRWKRWERVRLSSIPLFLWVSPGQSGAKQHMSHREPRAPGKHNKTPEWTPCTQASGHCVCTRPEQKQQNNVKEVRQSRPH